MRDVTRRHVGEHLVGTKEAAEVFGVRPQNFVRDLASRPDFPEPLAELAATRVWSRRELEAFRDRRLGIRWPPRRRTLRLSPDAERWLPAIKRRIVRRFGPERIILFGSQARGEADPGSDIDLLVVLPEERVSREARVALRRALADLPVAKDVVVTSPARVRRYGRLVGTVLLPALEEGVTVYARR